jgi:hypothetical protein
MPLQGVRRGHAQHFLRPEARNYWTLSWESAQEEAGKWIGARHLGRDLTGKSVDLSLEELPFDGIFRKMVLNAIARKLKKRGAREIILPPEE